MATLIWGKSHNRPTHFIFAAIDVYVVLLLWVNLNSHNIPQIRRCRHKSVCSPKSPLIWCGLSQIPYYLLRTTFYHEILKIKPFCHVEACFSQQRTQEGVETISSSDLNI